MLDPLFLQVLPGAPGAAVPVPVVSGFRAEVVPLVVHLIGALSILLVGGLLAGLVRFFLRKFSLDSRFCSAVPNGLDRSCAATIYPVLDKPRSTGILGPRAPLLKEIYPLVFKISFTIRLDRS